MPELAEGARLEIVCSGNPGTVGSNPTLSAIFVIILTSLTTTFDKKASSCPSVILGMMVAIRLGLPL